MRLQFTEIIRKVGSRGVSYADYSRQTRPPSENPTLPQKTLLEGFFAKRVSNQPPSGGFHII